MSSGKAPKPENKIQQPPTDDLGTAIKEQDFNRVQVLVSLHLAKKDVLDDIDISHSGHREPPLGWAIGVSSKEIVAYLLKNGSDPLHNLALPHYINRQGKTFLTRENISLPHYWLAARLRADQGDEQSLEIAKTIRAAIIKERKDVEPYLKSEQTKDELAKLIYDFKANISKPDAEKRLQTLLEFVRLNPQLEFNINLPNQILAERDANKNIIMGLNLFEFIALKGNAGLLKLVYDVGARSSIANLDHLLGFNQEESKLLPHKGPVYVERFRPGVTPRPTFERELRKRFDDQNADATGKGIQQFLKEKRLAELRSRPSQSGVDTP